MRALRDFNIPKIAFADIDIFFGLLGDLFPSIHVERKRDMNFEGEIVKACETAQLNPEPEFVLKVV
jgi:dynein heavy chain